MARKKKSSSILSGWDSPKRKGKRGGSILGSMLSSGKRKGKKSRSMFDSVLGSGSRKGKRGGSLFDSVLGGGRKGKRSKSLFDSISGGSHKGKRGGSLFDSVTGTGRGGGSMFGGGGLGFFGQSSYIEEPLGLNQGEYDRFIRSSDYNTLQQYLAAKGYSSTNRNAILSYIMRFGPDYDDKVKEILGGVSSGGFGSARSAAWAYAQWNKYMHDENFRYVLDYMGVPGTDVNTTNDRVMWYLKHAPQGIGIYLQDRFIKMKDDKKGSFFTKGLGTTWEEIWDHINKSNSANEDEDTHAFG